MFTSPLEIAQRKPFFDQNPEMTEGASGASLGKRLFTSRLVAVFLARKTLGANQIEFVN